MLISILLASMNRHDLLMQSIRSLYETTKGFDMELIAMIDCDKQSYRDVFDFLYSNDYRGIVSFSSTARGAIYSWNEALRLSSGDILFVAGDDSLYESDWLANALEVWQNKLDGFGMVGINDALNSSDKFATTMLCDRVFCRQILGGIVAPPTLKYYCCDIYVDELARKAGRWAYCENSIVRHLHPSGGRRPVDSTDESHMRFSEQDIRELEAWRGRGRPIEWASVIP